MNRRVPAPPEGDRPIRTLDRVVSKSGVGSRRDARETIAEKRVRVNGAVETDADRWIDLERDQVMIDGRPLESPERVYYALHKPVGYLTTYRHPKGRATIYDLLPEGIGWVFPMGRLDLDTSGLLLMTNDSDFSESIMNPRFHVPRTYDVLCAGELAQPALAALERGIDLDDGPTRPAGVACVRNEEAGTRFELTITEGRNRQVRRMIEAIGSRVLDLRRISIGAVVLGNLPPGMIRPLDRDEVDALRLAARGD